MKKQIKKKVKILCDAYECKRVATGQCNYCNVCLCKKCTEEYGGECPDCQPPRIIPFPKKPNNKK